MKSHRRHHKKSHSRRRSRRHRMRGGSNTPAPASAAGQPCEGHGAGTYVLGKVGGVDQHLANANSSPGLGMAFAQTLKPNLQAPLPLNAAPSMVGGRRHRSRRHRKGGKKSCKSRRRHHKKA